MFYTFTLILTFPFTIYIYIYKSICYRSSVADNISIYMIISITRSLIANMFREFSSINDRGSGTVRYI